MQTLFQTHPYSTAVGILIERATDSGKLNIDWALILEICDALCETDDGPRDAIRAIRKRLTSAAGKDNQSIWYTLVLIEACVKNCGKRFQVQVANRDFLHDLIKILLPKYCAPIQIQTKILYMIKTWVDRTWDVPGRKDLEKVYATLRRKGVQFPSVAENAKLCPPSIVNMKRTTTDNCNSRAVKFSSAFRRLAGAVSSSSSSSSGCDAVREVVSGDARFRAHIGSGGHVLTSAAASLDEMHRFESTRSMSNADDLWRRNCYQNQHHRSTGQGPMPDGVGRLQAGGQQQIMFNPGRAHHHGPCVYSRPRSRNSPARAVSPRQLQLVAPVNGVSIPTRYCQSSGAACLVSSSVPPVTNYLSVLSPDRTYVDEEGTVRRLSSAQREKLSQDLTVVQTNLHILNDMLTELQPDSINHDDLELLQELNESCRIMQQRVAEFLAQVADDAVTLSLLQLNDELNGAFQRYDRFERYRLRAIRAMVSSSPHRTDGNASELELRPALTYPSSNPAPLALSLHPQAQSSQTPVNTALLGPLAITGPESKTGDDGEESDGDDDKLFDEIAEQTQLAQSQLTASGSSGPGDLIDISNWAATRPTDRCETGIDSGQTSSASVSENIVGLASLRLDDGFVNNLQTDTNECHTVQLQRIFGPNFPSACSNTVATSCSEGGNSTGSGFLMDTLVPTPAPPLVSVKKETKQAAPSDRIDEALLIFEY